MTYSSYPTPTPCPQSSYTARADDLESFVPKRPPTELYNTCDYTPKIQFRPHAANN
jgi:hypothetical protein